MTAITQPVKEIIRRITTDDPAVEVDLASSGFSISVSYKTDISGVKVTAVSTSSAVLGVKYSGYLVHDTQVLRVTDEEAEALYKALGSSHTKHSRRGEQALRDAISAHLGVSTTQTS